MRVELRCPVRGCTETLAHRQNRWECVRNHSFDVSRSGALTLLQPQDRRSKNPGDSREAAQARRRLAAFDHARTVHDAFLHVLRSADMKRPALLDVGCGEGAFLRAASTVPGIELHGIDLSAPSADMAAKSLPEGLFVVANADRSLPYADRSFTFIASIDSRIHANEFARVLSSEGLVLVAVPGAEDLIELRERVAGRRVERPRTERVLEAMNALFRVVERTTVAESRHCGPEALRDLLTATYRGFRRTERVAVEHLDSMSVTLSHDVIAFRAR